MASKEKLQMSFADIDDQEDPSAKKHEVSDGEVRPRKSAPYNPGSDTSYAAAKSIEKPAGKLRMRVLAYVAAHGSVGATCDEAVRALGMIHQTCSARLNELRGDHLIADSGRRRATSSGRSAAVMVVTQLGLDELRASEARHTSGQ